MIWFTFFMVTAAVTSMVRLVVNEKILDRPRLWWTRHLPKKIVQMLNCPWCVSFWLALVVTGLLAIFRDIPLPVLWFLGAWRYSVALYWGIEVLAKYAQPDEQEDEEDE